jgi:hypothetical protein
MQMSFRASGPETIKTYLQRFEYRIRFYRFFFLAPLYLALPFFVTQWREYRFLWVALTLLIFALGVNFYPFFEVHYLGALTCLFVLVSIVGLQQIGPKAAGVIVFLCLAHFAFWYVTSFFERHAPDRHQDVRQKLAQMAGKQLVLVRYWPQHIFQDEWVYNEADIDRANVVWARDLGTSEDRRLLQYYPDRTVWLLEPDAMPPRLTRYQPEQEQPKPAISVPNTSAPLRFEQVH